MSKIRVQDLDITLINQKGEDYISLTEMVSSHDDGSKLIERWLNSKSTVDYLGAWESIYNLDFNSPEFRGIREDVGSGGYFLSAKKWVATTNAIGITAKTGRYGGTFAHVDIALEFATYISPLFKLLLITEFKKYKELETKNLKWDFRRYISKVNYKIQTDAVKSILIPIRNYPKEKEAIVYAEEADLLYDAMFGYTSKEWRQNNPELALKGLNIRDVANTHQLIILSNLESMNAVLIKNGVTDIKDRLIHLRREAISQLTSLKSSSELEHEIIESPNKLLKESAKITKPTKK
ncbi:hypothetical protein ABIB40_001650 [Pedobacter sp. UYP30]|uniref:KilA-N domain-containing protein n=1 Tax=Pedobacter sp. UYP30 TaxID=1756400 RepID=UPI0033990192